MKKLNDVLEMINDAKSLLLSYGFNYNQLANFKDRYRKDSASNPKMTIIHKNVRESLIKDQKRNVNNNRKELIKTLQNILSAINSKAKNNGENSHPSSALRTAKTKRKQ